MIVYECYCDLYLLQTHPVGAVIYSPIVTDADSGTNREISFQLVSPVSLKILTT